MRESEHNVEIWAGAVELLAGRTVPVDAGVRHEVFLPTVDALVWVAAQRLGVTGGDGVKEETHRADSDDLGRNSRRRESVIRHLKYHVCDKTSEGFVLDELFVNLGVVLKQS